MLKGRGIRGTFGRGVWVGCGAAMVAGAAHAGIRGDVNGDKLVDGGDVATLADAIAQGGRALQRSTFVRRADMNADQRIDQRDLALLVVLVGHTGEVDDASRVGEDEASGGGGAGQPSPEEDDPARFSAELTEDGKLVVHDLLTGGRIAEALRSSVWSPAGDDPHPIEPTLEVENRDFGFDLIVRFHNTTALPGDLGVIKVGGFDLGDAIFERDFRYEGKEQELDSEGRNYKRGGMYYPSGLYSPVSVMRSDEMTIGVALQYPILEYKHQVYIRAQAEYSLRWGHGWYAMYKLNPRSPTDVKHSEEGRLAPGEQREYVFSVRFAPAGVDWLRTLEPYKEFFRSNYGEVQYTRDPRPVHCETLAGTGESSMSNPFGFRNPYRRPDQNGFGPTVDSLLELTNGGWERTMIWGPSGVRHGSAVEGMPFTMATAWTAELPVTHAMHDASEQFPRLPAQGVELGFWWGDSAQIWTTWRGTDLQELDTDNAQHVAAAFAELDAAYGAGARTIGLDAFRRMQIWKAFPHVQAMRQRAPGAKFIVEPPMGDVMHAIAPCFLVATRPENELELQLEEKHHLADFLLPGHETWGFIRRDRLGDQLSARGGTRGRGDGVNDADLYYEMQRVASLGYIAVSPMEGPVDHTLLAAETWNQEE